LFFGEIPLLDAASTIEKRELAPPGSREKQKSEPTLLMRTGFGLQIGLLKDGDTVPLNSS
jgi:hypothetical protein